MSLKKTGKLRRQTSYRLKILIEEKPLTSNQCWQGRRFKTKAYKHFEELLLYTLPKLKKAKGKIFISYRFHLRYCAITDCDNLIKSLQDILEKKGYFENDRMIYKMVVEKIPSKKDFIEVEIRPYLN